MRKSELYIGLAAVFPLLSGCYKDIDLDEYLPDPVIVVNSAVAPGSTLMASVTRSWPYTEVGPSEELDCNLPQARVELYVNDEYRERLCWEQYLPADSSGIASDSVFRSHTLIKEGDRIQLSVSAEGYQTVTAETDVPRNTPVMDAECVSMEERVNPEGDVGDGYGNIIGYNYYALTYHVTFRDDPDTDNYYALTCLRKSGSYYTDEEYRHPHIETSDPVLKENVDILDGAMGFDGINQNGCFLFTDRQIAGKRYTLSFEEWTTDKSGNDLAFPLKIRLYSLSKDYYLYLYSVCQITGSTVDEALGNLGFGEPPRVYSNVEGGAGILGACTMSEREISVDIRQKTE